MPGFSLAAGDRTRGCPGPLSCAAVLGGQFKRFLARRLGGPRDGQESLVAAPLAATVQRGTPGTGGGGDEGEGKSILGRSLRGIVFGMNDGVITTISFLAGLHASLSHTGAVLLAGIAEGIAGSLAMACGEYISSKSEREWFDGQIERERRHIREYPESEREEVRASYRQRGFTGQQLEEIVRHITADRELWLEFMLREELGVFKEHQVHPALAAGLMGASFLAGAVLPLLPYFLGRLNHPFSYSLGLAAAGLFALGAAKTRLTRAKWWKSGLEMAVLGALAAGAGYLLGLAVARATGLGISG